MEGKSPSSNDGLIWEETLFGQKPQWTRDVSLAAVEDVCRQQLGIAPTAPCTVAFLATGQFNKLYAVEGADNYGPLILHVSLPVYPHCKTSAEVATLRWVCAHVAAVPVPQVLAFSDRKDNALGYEWILMERMPGQPTHRRWRTMSMAQKVMLTQRIAAMQAELGGRQPTSGSDSGSDSGSGSGSGTLFRGIGTLDVNSSAPGRMVSHAFFCRASRNLLNHANVPRGPFSTSHDWLYAVLHAMVYDQTAVLAQTEDEDDREDAEACLAAARRLLTLLPTIFPPTDPGTDHDPEPTVLYHDDLHLNNILVNDAGAVTAVLDWECVSALPVWVVATMVPKFLDGPVREDEPQRDEYGDETAEEAASSAARCRDDPDCLDNEGKNELYFIHLMEYEATQLRRVYWEHLRGLWPDCPREEEGNALKMEFYNAVLQCAGIWANKAYRWADRVAQGERIRFEDA